MQHNQLAELERTHQDLTRQMADPEIVSDPARYRTAHKALTEIDRVVQLYREHQGLDAERRDTEEMLAELPADDELRPMAEDELATLRQRLGDLEASIHRELIPKDPNDERNVVLEIRAGTGGDEATLFASELFRMYSRYAEGQGFKVEMLDLSESGVGGVKEVQAIVEGRGAYSRLKFEAGVHRVQRVPQTEASGRIHTSAVTVAVLPEAEAVEVEVDDRDLRIDTYCSSGAGGQHVNTTQSAVRITHLPTGLVVTCQDERSQIKNRAKAMRVLKSRLLELQLAESHAQESAERRRMVGSGDRSEKIRTYNFPQNRVTDHRIGLTLHQLPSILQGDLDPVVDPLVEHFQAEQMRADAAEATR